ncbi:MAG: FHA domain-containing protein [Myxococcales bacterium]|nr:FHA domain-containing protein [Myxococcales bacterium]
MTACQRCGRENQEHYKFCLGCGAELPKQDSAPRKDFKLPTPASIKAPSLRPSGRVSQVPAETVHVSASAPAEATVACAACGIAVPKSFRFCGGCGHAMAAASASAPEASQPAGAGASTRVPSLVLIQADGTDGEAFALSQESTMVGRETDPLFASDSFLSPRHATFARRSDVLTVTDEASLNGVYLRIAPNTPIELNDGSMFRIGQEILKVQSHGPDTGQDSGVDVMGSPARGIVGRIATVIGYDVVGDAFPVLAGGLHMGRERGDVLFPDDGYVSGLHCRIHHERGKLMLTDVGSSNGTYVRLESGRAVTLNAGDLLLLGQQLFRVQI